MSATTTPLILGRTHAGFEIGDYSLEAQAIEVETPKAGSRAWIGYVAPMATFTIMTTLERQFQAHYLWMYSAKVIIVTALLIAGMSGWKRDIRANGRMLLIGAVVGLAAFVLWIVLDRITPPLKFLGTRVGYNPFKEIADPATRTLFLSVRFLGLALMVPLMEELFWRSFLLRWITDQEYEKLAVGTFSWGAFALVAGAFGFAHPEWLAGIVFAVLMALLLRRTRSLFSCIVAHSVTNLALGIYVLVTHHWHYW